MVPRKSDVPVVRERKRSRPPRLLVWLEVVVLTALVTAGAYYGLGIGSGAGERSAWASDRTDFIDEVKSQLKDFKSEMGRISDKLADKSSKLSESARRDLEKKQDRLGELTDKAEQQLKDAQEKTDENWEASKPHFKDSWNELKSAFGSLFGKGS